MKQNGKIRAIAKKFRQIFCIVGVTSRGRRVDNAEKLTAISLLTRTWAHLGGEHVTRVPHFFRRWGYNMPCPLTVFSFGFKNKSDVCHVLYEELFMLDFTQYTWPS